MSNRTDSVGEYGFFFCYKDRQKAERDFLSFCEIAKSANDIPCNFFLSVAQWTDERRYPFVVAMILPAEYEQQVSGWLGRHKIYFGDTVDGTKNVTDFYQNTKDLKTNMNFVKSTAR